MQDNEINPAVPLALALFSKEYVIYDLHIRLAFKYSIGTIENSIFKESVR
jgi:hypothetical protein